MTMKLIDAISSMKNGGVVFAEDVDKAALPMLDAMVGNTDLCKCQNSDFVWYFAWVQKDTESHSDKAHQMAKAVRTSRR